MGLSRSCDARVQAPLPLCEGGLGLRSAVRSRPAANFGSWADALKMIKQRHPGVASTNCSSIQPLLRCAEALEAAGFQGPSWADLAEGGLPEGISEDGDPCQPCIGWQKQAATCFEKQFLSRDVWPRLIESCSRRNKDQWQVSHWFRFPQTESPCSSRSPSAFSVMRRLRLLLSLFVRSCRWPSSRRPWPRSCATAGGGWAFKSIRDMDLAIFDNFDGRRLEVVAHGLPLTEAHSLPSTQRWSHLSTATVLPGEEHRTRKGSLWRPRANARK